MCISSIVNNIEGIVDDFGGIYNQNSMFYDVQTEP